MESACREFQILFLYAFGVYVTFCFTISNQSPNTIKSTNEQFYSLHVDFTSHGRFSEKLQKQMEKVGSFMNGIQTIIHTIKHDLDLDRNTSNTDSVAVPNSNDGKETSSKHETEEIIKAEVKALRNETIKINQSYNKLLLEHNLLNTRFLHLQNKSAEIELSYRDLSEKHYLLKDSFLQLQNESRVYATITQDKHLLWSNQFDEMESTLDKLKNKTGMNTVDAKLSPKNWTDVIQSLRQDFTVNQKSLESNLETLRSKLSALPIRFSSPNQKFLVLRNTTKTKLAEFETKLSGQVNNTKTLTDRFADLENVTNTFVAELSKAKYFMSSEIKNIKHRVLDLNDKSKMVALSARAGKKTRYFSSQICYKGDIIKFANIEMSVGVQNTDEFKRSGKFTCEYPGIYLFSAYLMSNSKSSQFTMMKNGGLAEAEIFITEGPKSNSGAGTVVVSLNVNDTLFVEATYANITIYDFYGGFTVVRIGGV